MDEVWGVGDVGAVGAGRGAAEGQGALAGVDAAHNVAVWLEFAGAGLRGAEGEPGGQGAQRGVRVGATDECFEVVLGEAPLPLQLCGIVTGLEG